tara:strand:- start:274 stop:486 length:213 start_codon:yes stop_codon:yes gene_type:complete
MIISVMREFPQMGCVEAMDDSLSLEELREEVDDLRQLVKTLLTIIMEEADGVQTGSAPSIPDQPKRGYCM